VDIDELERAAKDVEAGFVEERRGFSHGANLCGERIARNRVLSAVEGRPEARIGESLGGYSETRRVLPMNERMLYIAVLAIFKLLGQQKSIQEVKDAVNEATKDYDKHNPPY
jgi:hypothetical protein